MVKDGSLPFREVMGHIQDMAAKKKATQVRAATVKRYSQTGRVLPAAKKPSSVTISQIKKAVRATLKEESRAK